MKLVDLNLLVYAVDSSSSRHRRARACHALVLSGSETVALPWVVLLGFLRLSTRSAVFASPLTADEALDVVEGWLQQPAVTVVHAGSRHVAVLRELLTAFGTAGNVRSAASVLNSCRPSDDAACVATAPGRS